MNGFIFMAEYHSVSMLTANLAALGIFFRKEDMVIVHEKLFEEHSSLFPLEGELYSSEFSNALINVLRHVDKDDNFQTRKMQNQLKKSFRRKILTQILNTDFFGARSAINIAISWDTILRCDYNMVTFKETSHIDIQYSFDIKNKILIGLANHLSEELSEDIKHDIIEEFIEMVERLENENKVAERSTSNAHALASFILDNF